jgi:hypothetical protein
MIWQFQNKALANYWLKVFALYALTEACIQLLFFFILNNYGTNRITIIEFHFVMCFFQCLLIWPIWWVAWSVKHKNAVVQIVINVAFYVVYSLLWFGPVQDAIGFFYNELQHLPGQKANYWHRDWTAVPIIPTSITNCLNIVSGCRGFFWLLISTITG